MAYPDSIFNMKYPDEAESSLPNLEEAVSVFLLVDEDEDWAKVDVVANHLDGNDIVI